MREWIIWYDDIMSEHTSGELVRCKDCKFMEYAINGRGEHGYYCNNSDSPVDNNRWLDADWYCADGERRTDE